jgi:hypothetical protein
MTLSSSLPSSTDASSWWTSRHAPDDSGDVPFFDDRERAIVLDSLYALEAQLDGGTPLPPVDDAALHQRIHALARRVGASQRQLVLHWIEWATGETR